jgi:hypothetical protein
MEYRNEGIIEPTTLSKGVRIFIETVAKVFEFEMLEGGRAIVRSTGRLFKKNTPCQIVGSLSKEGKVFPDMIVRDKHLILALPKGRYVTGLIRSAALQGPTWYYEMWQTNTERLGSC